MRFDQYITVINGAVDADPVATPAAVPAAHVFQLRTRDMETEQVSTRVIFGLEAPLAENVDFELYALDQEDDAAAPAVRVWYRVCTVAALGGGRLWQTRLDQPAEAFVGGGTFYVRVTAEAVTANRRLGIRAASS